MGRDSSAAKPPLSPLGPSSPKSKGSKFNAALSNSDQKAKGILKESHKAPSRNSRGGHSQNIE